MTTLTYRSALPDDASTCVELRAKTRENAISAEVLNSFGITHESLAHDIGDGTWLGHVCIAEARVVAYCFGAARTGEVTVLAVLPEYEGQGIGKSLLDFVLRDFKILAFRRAVLGCSSNPRSRSHGFYRHLGWQSTGAKSRLRESEHGLKWTGCSNGRG
jgi:GNAT superfamily N-acetyltransferase